MYGTDALTSSQKNFTLEQSEYQLSAQIRERARSIPVPTDPSVVTRWLRAFREPKILFGEGPYDQRERLRFILASDITGLAETLLSMSAQSVDGEEAASGEDSVESDDEFYTIGNDLLTGIRSEIIKDSLKMSKIRLLNQKKCVDRGPSAIMSDRKRTIDSGKSLNLISSQYGSEKPLTAIGLFSGSKRLVVGDSSGALSFYGLPDCQFLLSHPVHDSRIGFISVSKEGYLASCDVEGTVSYSNYATISSVDYSNSENSSLSSADILMSKIVKLQGHTGRVTRVAHHPTKNLLGSTGFDRTWRLWDPINETMLQAQEGHEASVCGIDFHPDGALVATGCLDGICRLWDLRCGKSIWTFGENLSMIESSHVKETIDNCGENLSGSMRTSNICTTKFESISKASGILSLCFSDHASGAPVLGVGHDDGICRVWDLRKRCKLASIPAHSGPVSSISFHTTCFASSVEENIVDDCKSGVLVSAGFDGEICLWARPDWRLVTRLKGHESRIVGISCDSSSNVIASASADRTFKVWS